MLLLVNTTEWEPSCGAAPSAPEIAAVQAHVLLNSLAVMAGRAATMRLNWDDLPPETRTGWLADAERMAVDAAELLRLMVQGHAVVELA